MFQLLAQFQKMVSETVYQRGVQYFRSGRIREYRTWRVNEDYWQISAVVEGTEKYQVRVRVGIVKGHLDLEAYCECPYDWEEYCKHAVAVIYRFLSGDNPEDKPAGFALKTAKSNPGTVSDFDSLQQHLQQLTAPPLELRYRINGVAKLNLANFRLSFDSASVDPKISQRIFDYALELSYRPSYFQLNDTLQYLNGLSNFDRMVLEHLRVIQTRKDAERRAVFFAKTPENFSFILTLIQNREAILDENGLRLVLAETLRPQGYLEGDTSKVSLRFAAADYEKMGIYCPELSYLLVDNQLHPVESNLSEDLAAEIEIPPVRQGEFIFETLPQLREKFQIEVAPAFGTPRLRVVRPEIRLCFDYRDEQICCEPTIRIEQRDYCGLDALQMMTTPIYLQPEPGVKEWRTTEKTDLHELESYLNEHGFVVSGEGIALKDSDKMVAFLISGFSQVPAEWSIETSADFDQFRVTPVTLEPVVEFNPDAGIDWFEFKIHYNLGGRTYSHREILTMLRKNSLGDRYIRIDRQIFLIERSDRIELMEKAVQATEKSNRHAARHEFYDLFFYRELFRNQGIKIVGNQIYNEVEQDLSRQHLVEAVPLPEGLNGELREYQREGFSWLHFLHKYHLGGILADDMGLGKTLQVLTFIKSLTKEKPVLVVCPRSLLYNWAAEIDKFYPGTSYLVYHGTPEERNQLRAGFSDQEIIITTYDLINRDEAVWREHQFLYGILDEAQHIKNSQTKRSQMIKQLRTKYRLVMTGTPIENNLDELWSLFDFLMPGYLGSKQKFTHQYVTPESKEGNQEALGLLKQRVAPFILRRRKEEVLAELPEKMIMLQKVFMTKLQEDTYRTVLEQVRQDVLESISSQGWEKSHITVLAALTKLRQICDHPRLVLPELTPGTESGKIDALMELTLEAIDAGHKLVIFSQFVKMLRVIEARFKEADIRYEYLDGATKDRMERINRFNETPEIAAFLISLKAGGVGINLTAADIVIHVDPWWNPMVENQATDRVHRIGQRNQVMVYKLITSGTVEEKMLQLQNRKKSVFDAVIEHNENPVNSLTWDDIKGMFEL